MTDPAIYAHPPELVRKTWVEWERIPGQQRYVMAFKQTKRIMRFVVCGREFSTIAANAKFCKSPECQKARLLHRNAMARKQRRFMKAAKQFRTMLESDAAERQTTTRRRKNDSE